MLGNIVFKLSNTIAISHVWLTDPDKSFFNTWILLSQHAKIAAF